MESLQLDAHIKPLLDKISDGVFSVDLDGRITYINHQALSIFNREETNIVGELMLEKLPEVFLQAFYHNIQKSLQDQVTLRFEVELPDHDIKWLEVHLYPGSDGVTVWFRDISVQKAVSQTIEENHKKLLLLSEAANHLLYKKEPKEILDSLFKELSVYLDLDVYFNYIFDESQNKIRLINYQGVSEQVAKEIEWLEFGEAVCGCVARDESRIVAENIDMSDDPRVKLIQGLGIKAYACHPLMSYGKLIGTLSFGSSRRSHFTPEELDLIFTICNQVAITLERSLFISKLKQKNIELEKSKNRAEKANQAKSEFLSMMSHELRTPLNSILGFLQILDESKRDPLTKKQKDKVSKIMKSSRHLLKIINDILHAAKIESGKPGLSLGGVKIGEMMEESLKIIQGSADKKSITIMNDTKKYEKIDILADDMRVNQVMLNLLSNAIKYNHDGGEVQITCEQQGSHMKFSVIDLGIGIPLHEHQNIFEPFYRIFNPELNIEGAGLGLTLVKQYVSEMGGDVGVSSVPNEGSLFWFTVPLVKASSKP